MKKPIWVIANPESAGGRGARVLPPLEAALSECGLEFSLHRTERPGHAREIGAEAHDLASRILIVGGDGTIHEVADGLLRERPNPPATPPPPLAVLPVGTGNDFFRMVRLRPNVRDAVRALTDGVPRYFEVGEVRWEGGIRHFVNLIGVGIDVEVLRRRSAFGRLPGLLQYLAALSVSLVHFEAIPLRVTVRSEEEGVRSLPVAPVLLSAVTVGPSVGGGFLLSPKAVPDDGLLDLFHVTSLGVLKVLRYLPGILKGTASERPEIAQAQGTEIRIESVGGRELDFELDGELVEASTSALDIRVLPARLQVLELPDQGE